MSFTFKLLLTASCLIVCSAVISFYCPPDCVCHETVWRCSNRRVTNWPLDNLPHIIMHGVTVLDMSRSNIDVLPNWPPTHNFPDLKMVLLGDTVFDGERCRELECLQKLKLFVHSSCPADLRQGCSYAPCCVWSTPTTQSPSSTMAFAVNSSTTASSVRESLTPSIIEQITDNLPLQEDFSEPSTRVHDSITQRQEDERLVDVTEIPITEVTSVDAVSTSLPESSLVTTEDDRSTGEDERQLYSSSHHRTEQTTARPTSLLGSSLSEYGSASAGNVVIAGYDQLARQSQATPLHHPTVASIVEYVAIVERVPFERKPTIPLVQPTSITRAWWTAAGIRLFTSTIRPRVTSTRKSEFHTPIEVITSTAGLSLASYVPRSPEPTVRTATVESTTDRSPFKDKGVTTLESSRQTEPTKDYRTSTTTKKQSTLPVERRYYERPTSSGQTASNSSIATTEKSIEMSSVTSDTGSIPSSAVTETTTQTEKKSLEAVGTRGMIELFTTERMITAITPWINTTILPERVNVSVLLVADQDATNIPRKAESTTSVMSVVETTSVSEKYSELTSTATHPRNMENITAECTCPICPSCVAEFVGYQLSKDGIGGIAAGMVILFLAVIILLLRQCSTRVTESGTSSRESSVEPYYLNFQHPRERRHVRRKPKDDCVREERRTHPDTTIEDGRFNNNYAQPHVHETGDLRGPPTHERGVSVEIIDDRIPPTLPNAENLSPSSSESALHGAPVQLSGDDAQQLDGEEVNHIGLIALPDTHDRDMALEALAVLANSNGHQASTSGSNGNGQSGGNHRAGDADLSGGPANSPSRVALFLNRARQVLSPKKNAHHDNDAGKVTRKPRGQSAPPDGERAVTRSATLGIVNHNAPAYANLPLAPVDEG